MTGDSGGFVAGKCGDLGGFVTRVRRGSWWFYDGLGEDSGDF